MDPESPPKPAPKLAPGLAKALRALQDRHGRTWYIRPAQQWYPDGTPRWWVASRRFRVYGKAPGQEDTVNMPTLPELAAGLDEQARIDATAPTPTGPLSHRWSTP